MSVCARIFAVLSVCALATVSFGQNSAQRLVTETVDEGRLAVLKGNTHPLARAEFDRGLAPLELPMNRMLLVLKRSAEQEAALQTLLDDQQEKASPNYHKWLSPEEFGRQFGPSDQDVQIVTSWLQSQGFQIAQVSKGRTLVEFSGTAAQVQEALHTSIHKYAVNGEEHWANANDPLIPTALTPVVAGVFSLHDFMKKPHLHIAPDRIHARVSATAPGKPPQVTFPGSPAFHALAPADYATIYNINPIYAAGNQGQKVTIAVVGRSDLFGQDVSNFDNVFGVAGSGYRLVLNGPDPGDLGGGEEGEATLDVTWASAIAPGANIDFVVSASTNTTDGVDLSEAYIVDNNLADVMTESFGACEAFSTSSQAAGISSLAEQAAAEGITYIVSSGDDGAEGCDPNSASAAQGPVSVNVLASTPFNVAVGGTMFNENGQDSAYWSSTNAASTLESALAYIPEEVWNESCAAASCGQNANILAGSGGASTFFSKPTWQSGVRGIPADHARDVPDVSLTAAGHDPYLLCLEGSCVPDAQGNIFFAGVSGTSASAPSFAGIMALVESKVAQTNQTGFRQGQANYILYRLAAAEDSILSQCNASKITSTNCVFNDVTVGNNAVPGEIGYGLPNAQYQSSVGYDLATGLGSVNVANLVNSWSSVTFRPTTTTIALSPTTIVHGSPVNVTVHVTSNSGGGIPSGDVSLLTPGGTLFFTLDGTGSASTITRSLPGGSYTVTAYYAGDGTFAPSTSVSSNQITVNRESTITRLSVLGAPAANGAFSPFTSGPYGSFVYLRADVSASSGQGIPTGLVNFNDAVGSTLVTSLPLNSQGNTETPNGDFNLEIGSHSITAQYAGDNSFITSISSPPITVTITQAPTTTAVTASVQPQGVSLMATVNSNSGGNPPNGTIQFSINGAPVGNPVQVSGIPAAVDPQTGAVVGAQATASYTDTQLTTGKYTTTAAYSGDSHYLASNSSSIPVNVQPDFSITPSATTLTISSPGGSGSVNVTVAALNGFSGTVTFACSGLPVGAHCTGTSVATSGMSVLTVSTTAASSAALETNRSLFGAKWTATLGMCFAGLFLIGVPRKRERYILFVTAALIGAAILTGCGGGGGTSTPPVTNPATPVGTYTVTVTATSGTLSHNTSLQLTVQ